MYHNDYKNREKKLEIKNVNVFYDNRPVLKNINLKVYENQLLAIIGPNGGGKTTLLQVIAGLKKPDRGKVKIYSNNKIVGSRNLVGYVAQASSFDNNFPVTVKDVILMGALKPRFTFFHSYNDENLKKVEEIVNRLGITELINRQIGELSGGQLQKVLIGRALMSEPQLLLLDEPTSSLDSSAASNIYNLLNKLNDDMTIIVVTHNLTAVSSYFDSLACLNKELHYHDDKDIAHETVKKVYGCPVELIAHGVPHRVLATHEEE